MPSKQNINKSSVDKSEKTDRKTNYVKIKKAHPESNYHANSKKIKQSKQHTVLPDEPNQDFQYSALSLSPVSEQDKPYVQEFNYPARQWKYKYYVFGVFGIVIFIILVFLVRGQINS
jgi:hypothetical protein